MKIINKASIRIVITFISGRTMAKDNEGTIFPELNYLYITIMLHKL